MKKTLFVIFIFFNLSATSQYLDVDTANYNIKICYTEYKEIEFIDENIAFLSGLSYLTKGYADYRNLNPDLKTIFIIELLYTPDSLQGGVKISDLEFLIHLKLLIESRGVQKEDITFDFKKTNLKLYSYGKREENYCVYITMGVTHK